MSVTMALTSQTDEFAVQDSAISHVPLTVSFNFELELRVRANGKGQKQTCCFLY